MSVWTEPKTNWSGAKNEYFNIQPDYQRIKGNIEFLGDYLGYIGFDKNNLYKMENVTLESVPKQTFFNNIVYNIDILRNFIGTPINYQNMRTYVSKGNVWNYKDLNIIEKNIRPYFKDLKLSDITTKIVMRWQNKLMNKTYSKEDKKYSPETLKTIHSQLSAILNHACKYYGLKMNAAAVAGNIKVEQKKEKEFWTFEEYSKFIDAISDKTLSYISYEILFWCGLRLGELRALTKADIDLEAKTINVNKSMQTIKGKNIVTDPKTSNSIRVVDMPDFIVDELRNYMDHLYKVGDDDYLFPVSKSYMHHEMDRGCKKSEVKRIRVHGLRHSHITMLIENGFSAKDVGKRVGHSAEKITYLYAHSYDERGKQMANKLDEIEGGDDESKGSR